MCGIVGYSGIPDRSFLKKMNEAQVHRGPDDAGEFWFDKDQVALAMRRLSIVDLSGGHQPMFNSDHSIALVFNGEIFNAAAIRKVLENKGSKFVTDHSDTEVILRAYEHEGMSFVRQLNGMFAFVLFDARKRIIAGARDPFGIKPLYLHKHAKGIAWASELKSLLVLPTFSREVDAVAAEQYLGLQYVPRDRSIFKSAFKLRPGHRFEFNIARNELTTERFHFIPEGVDRITDENATKEMLRAEFTGAVDRWSISDVPIACSLSGGIDSAAIVAALSRNGHHVRTYTLGFASAYDDKLDERVEARSVADMYRTEHHEMVIEADDLLKVLPQMVRSLDEPYGGGLPSWYIYDRIAKDYKVAMTGTGGDELFTNYNKFFTLELRPEWSRYYEVSTKHRGLATVLSKCSGLWSNIRMALMSAEDEISVRRRHEIEDAALMWTKPFGLCYPTAHGRGFNERLSSEHREELSAGRALLGDVFAEYSGRSLRNRCVAVDLETQLPDEFLQMTDRFSMAHSLEARTPFLDLDFSTKVLSLDPADRFTPWESKKLFKDAVADWLPEGYTKKRKKGFTIPTARWLRGPLRNQAMELFEPSALKASGVIRSDFRDAFYKRFLDGELNLEQSVWTAFMYRMWEQEYLRV